MPDARSIADAWAAAWSSSDSEAFAALFAPDAVYRDDQAGRVSHSRADLLAFHTHFAAALSEVKLEFTNVFQSGEHACMEWMSSGLQSGTFHGRPPSNKRFAAPGVSVLRIAPDGKIASCVDYYDGLLLSRQLGAMASV